MSTRDGMSVWLVFRGQYSDQYVDAAYTSEARAREAIADAQTRDRRRRRFHFQEVQSEPQRVDLDPMIRRARTHRRSQP